MDWRIMYAYHWLRSVFISLDQFVNALLGSIPRLRGFGFGDPDETISSRLGKLERDGNPYAAFACKIISFILRDDCHCIEAIEEDEG